MINKYLEIVWGNAATVVDDLKPLFAEVFEGDFDAGGAGVQAVFDEFLDGGREVEDDLTGADSVNDALADRLDDLSFDYHCCFGASSHNRLPKLPYKSTHKTCKFCRQN